MRVDEVPQDDSILEGHRRACYARDSEGRYVLATSRGWAVESAANAMAVAAVSEHIERTRRDVLSGKSSPLAYHMARCHMDARMLASATGMWSMRVRRHLRPDVFEQLSDAVLARYAHALGIDTNQLRNVAADSSRAIQPR
jgi:hypothetical protein